MNFENSTKSDFEKVVVIVQCRLSSTRLPKKALYVLAENSSLKKFSKVESSSDCVKNSQKKVLLDYALSSMKRVNADEYFLACDFDSEKELAPIAAQNGFKIFAGQKDDVLDRFCSLIKMCGAKIVVRATADNPFLFFDAANDLLELYKEKYFGKVDYITFKNLPHGSGIEIFNGDSLLAAREKTFLPYDHEHVGPALYNHQDNFNCLFLPAPKKYDFPKLRTTIDTYADFLRARDAIFELKKQNKNAPFLSEDIIKVFCDEKISKKILFVPSIKKGHGTGHLVRCIELAKKANGVIFLDDEFFSNDKLFLNNENFENQKSENLQNKNLIPNLKSLLQNFDSKKIITKFPLQNEYDLIVCDKFKMSKSESKKYSSLGKTLFLDEGNFFLNAPDFSLNVIPSINSEIDNSTIDNFEIDSKNNLKKSFKKNNLFAPSFLDLPKNKKSKFPTSNKIEKILICFGGEDKKNLAQKFINVFEKNDFKNFNFQITVVTKNKINFSKNSIFKNSSNLQIVDKIENLKERLAEFDLVITHYGFTAFECAAANVPVILSAPSNLHKKLSKKYGFYFIDKNQINKNSIFKALKNILKLRPSEEFLNLISNEKKSKNSFEENSKNNLSSFILKMSNATKYNCPLCQNQNFQNDKIVSRTVHHTFRKCSNCKMIYISFSDDSDFVEYEKSYFADEYKNQYGRTYLEDFESIKRSCVMRVKNIDKVLKINSKKNQIEKNKNAAISEKNNLKNEKIILDIGCAYGPFLSAANDDGYKVFGSDISESAIDYVKNELGFNAIISSFADFDSKKEFGVEQFDAITMWYVIEHIKNLKSTLILINEKLKLGGVFAFSTPNANGLSRKINSQKFFEQSPKDHYSLFELQNTKKYLSRYGFKISKIVSTGIHPERIPFVKKSKFLQNKFFTKIFSSIIKVFKIGDTYEVYCKKVRELKN